MAATINDVAKKAEVSLGTVSRYLNGYKLRPANAERVEAAIAELGFKFNILGKALRQKKSLTIGVAIHALTDIYSTSVVTAVERVAESEGYTVLISDLNTTPEGQLRKLQFLRDRFVDGLIIFPSGLERCEGLLREMIADKTPVVLVNGDLPRLGTDRVAVDNAPASRRAIERFIAAGHRKIAIIAGPKDEAVAQERLNGCLEAFAAHGLPAHEQYIRHGDYLAPSAYQATRELMALADPPTALYVINYHMTLGTIMALNELNVRVPEELSLIGFDHFPLFDVIKPALTVIEQPTDALGEAAARLLLRRMGGDYGDYPSQTILPTRLLERQSVRRL